MAIPYLQCLPGSGKSTCEAEFDSVLDTDPLVLEITGDVTSESVEEFSRSSKFGTQFMKMISNADFKYLVSNLNLESGVDSIKGEFVCVGAVHYGNDYIEHIRSCGRDDLVELMDKVGEDTIAGWSTRLAKSDHAIQLKAGRFVTINLIESAFKKALANVDIREKLNVASPSESISADDDHDVEL